jgi:hypothetical protein
MLNKVDDGSEPYAGIAPIMIGLKQPTSPKKHAAGENKCYRDFSPITEPRWVVLSRNIAQRWHSAEFPGGTSLQQAPYMHLVMVLVTFAPQRLLRFDGMPPRSKRHLVSLLAQANSPLVI